MKRYEKGDIVILELKTGDVYDGIVYSQSPDRLSLCSTVEYPSGRLFENVCDFSTKEIETIHQIPENTTQTQENCITLNLKEYKHVTNLINSFKFINQMDKRFYDAISELESCESVGIDAKGSHIGRFYRITYFVMSVWNQVFVFDLGILDQIAFDSGLKTILENEFILKVCHNSQKLNDCLLHNYQVQIKNVFDILIADHTLQERKKDMNPKHQSLEECITKYFQVPVSFVDHIPDTEWAKRPLPLSVQQMIAVRCSFLLFLKNTLHKQMNKSINNITDKIYCMTLNPQIEDAVFPKRLLQML